MEPRQLLAVTVNVTPTGSMSVKGSSDGPIDIIAIGQNRFEVREGGNVVATVSGITQNMVVDLDSSTQSEDVGVYLFDQSLANVLVKLNGSGNHVEIYGDVPIDRAIYRGNDGNSIVKVGVETKRMSASFAGNGNNRFEVVANSERVRFRGGSGSDVVFVGRDVEYSSPETFNYAGIVVGDGNNFIRQSGHVVENFYLRGGEGVDNFDSYSGSKYVSLQMLGGENNVNFYAGYFTQIVYRGGDGNDNLYFDYDCVVGNRVGIITAGGTDNIYIDACIVDVFSRSDGGNDTFVFGPGSQIYNNALIVLGTGSNRFDHQGYIEGDLYVASFTSSDIFTISGNGIVYGEVRFRPGGQGG